VVSPLRVGVGQLHADTAQAPAPACRIGDLNVLLRDRTARRAPDEVHGGQRLGAEAAVLADDEAALARADGAEKGTHAEIAIGNPQVAGGNGGHHLPEQGALLGVAVRARKDINRQAHGGIEDHQRFARQGASRRRAQCLEPVLTAGQAVAVEILHPIARHQRRARALPRPR
jgi:hypothetical protein